MLDHKKLATKNVAICWDFLLKNLWHDGSITYRSLTICLEKGEGKGLDENESSSWYVFKYGWKKVKGGESRGEVHPLYQKMLIVPLKSSPFYHKNSLKYYQFWYQNKFKNILGNKVNY